MKYLIEINNQLKVVDSLPKEESFKILLEEKDFDHNRILEICKDFYDKKIIERSTAIHDYYESKYKVKYQNYDERVMNRAKAICEEHLFVLNRKN